MFRRYLYIALAVGVLAGFIGLGSALFTDSQSVANNTFTAGTVDISVTPTDAAITFANMAPGDKVTAPLTVSNAGSLDLRYAVTSVITDTGSPALSTQLVLAIRTGVTNCDNTGFSLTGTQIYTGTIGSTGGLNIIGDPTQGNQTGDRVVAPAANDVLCFHVSLPITTNNSYQGASTTATLAFAAEQTANNP